MHGEHILAPIAADIAQHRVNVVGPVLRVVVLDQEARRFDRVIVTLARLVAACPGKRELVQLGLDFAPVLTAQLGVGAVDVVAYEPRQQAAIVGAHARERQTARWRKGIGNAVLVGQDVGERRGADHGHLLLLAR